MLSQQEADYLIGVLKEFRDKNGTIKFPNATQQAQMEVTSCESKRDKFMIDINRKGQYNIKKCTFQTRYRNSIHLLRLDIDGPAHTNPNGEEIPCPHLHVYKEGYDVKWAFPMKEYLKTNTDDLIQVLIDFLKYNNVKNSNYIIEGGGLI